MLGNWKFAVELQGQTFEHLFEVLDSFIVSGVNAPIKPSIEIYPNPADQYLNVNNAKIPIEYILDTAKKY